MNHANSKLTYLGKFKVNLFGYSAFQNMHRYNYNLQNACENIYCRNLIQKIGKDNVKRCKNFFERHKNGNQLLLV